MSVLCPPPPSRKRWHPQVRRARVALPAPPRARGGLVSRRGGEDSVSNGSLPWGLLTRATSEPTSTCHCTDLPGVITGTRTDLAREHAALGPPDGVCSVSGDAGLHPRLGSRASPDEGPDHPGARRPNPRTCRKHVRHAPYSRGAHPGGPLCERRRPLAPPPAPGHHRASFHGERRAENHPFPLPWVREEPRGHRGDARRR